MSRQLFADALRSEKKESIQYLILKHLPIISLPRGTKTELIERLSEHIRQRGSYADVVRDLLGAWRRNALSFPKHPPNDPSPIM